MEHSCKRSQQQPETGTHQTVQACREQLAQLPPGVTEFKKHRLASCIAGTPLAECLGEANDVDRLAVQCWFAAARGMLQ